MFEKSPPMASVSFLSSRSSVYTMTHHHARRFHEKVHESLGQRRADVIELYQPLSPLMADIQSAIIECMEATLAELRRSNTSVSVDTPMS
jgi:hypothetical protein